MGDSASGKPTGPYWVLDPEPATAPSGSRFAGYWVTAWQSQLPCVQFANGVAAPIARTTPHRATTVDEVEPLLDGASVFVTANETWLEVARTVGVPTVFVADGAAPPPAGDVRVVTPPTAFRRDLLLSELHRAIDESRPGLLGTSAGESARCRDRLDRFLGGTLADLGHGGCKIDGDAIGVDFFRVDARDWIGDARDLWFFDDQGFDAVFSSHCLEDLWHPHQALAEWTRVLKPGGHLVLYLPLEGFYPSVGSPGANPGHKDDYDENDVSGFLEDLGHTEVVWCERREAEDSFEIVARKRSGRSWFVDRERRPRPEVSVLVVAEIDHPRAEATKLIATVEAAHASLGDVPHEILCLVREHYPADPRAAVLDLGDRIDECLIVEDFAPRPYASRFERLRAMARGRRMIVLGAGSIPLDDALRQLADCDDPVAVPRCVDPAGQQLDDVACLMLDESVWPPGRFESSRYRTARLWRAVAGPSPSVRSDAVVCSGGVHARALAGHGLAALEFDRSLSTDGVAPDDDCSKTILVSMLCSLGDSILATGVVDGLAAAHRGARITVLTEAPYAWVFAGLDTVEEVIAVPPHQSELFWYEDRALVQVCRSRRFDRVVVLSDRLDNAAYQHSGVTLADFYAIQAGLREAGPPRLAVAPEPYDTARATLAAFGITGDYAVVHARGGWAEKCLDDALSVALCAHLGERHGLPVVAVGGPGELVAHPLVLNLAGHVSMPESAAIIAGARVFVGVDSGPLHMASCFGVPTLALYGGSSLRVAPPFAITRVAVQSPTSCPMPCGTTPCENAQCGTAGLDAASLCRQLDRILAEPGTREELAGESPLIALWSSRGPTVWPRPASAAVPLIRPLEPAACTVPPTKLVTRTPANVSTVSVPADPGHVRALAELRGQPRVDGGSVPLTGLRPPVELAVAEALAVTARQSGLHHSAAAYLERGLIVASRIAHGIDQRPRPAFRQVADRLFAELVQLPAADRWSHLVGAGERYRRELGSWPDARTIACTIAEWTGDDAAPPHVREWLEQLWSSQPAWDGESYAVAVTLVRGLLRADAVDRAERLATASLEALPAAMTADAARLHYLRGFARTRDSSRLPEALADFRVASRHLEEHDQRAKALELCGTLERHLARALEAAT